jgi:DNA polymerase-3 subunit delta
VYLCGDEPYLRNREVLAAKETLCNLPRTELENETAANLFHRLQGHFLLSSPQLFISYNTKDEEALIPYVQNPEENTTLILVSDQSSVPEWVKNAKIPSTAYRKLKSWGSNNQFVSWLKMEARERGYTLDDRAAIILYRVIGDDLGALESELEKLVFYCGERTEIVPKDVASVTSLREVISPFKVAESVAARNRKQAFSRLRSLYERLSGSPELGVLGSMRILFERLLRVRELVDEGFTGESINSLLREMEPKVYMKNWATLVSRWNASDLAEVMRTLCQVEPDLVIGGNRTRLELLILELTTPR